MEFEDEALLGLDGLDVELEEEPDELTFEVGDDDELHLVDEKAGLASMASSNWDDNLAIGMSDSDLALLAGELVEAFDSDEASRAPWLKDYKKGLEVLGLKIDELSEPWDGASGVYHPLLAEALVRYVSEAALETYPPTGPASTSIIGTENTETLKRAARVKAEMNYQCTVKMPEDRPEFERTLWRQGLAGSCFRKVYYDRVLKRPRRMMVPAEDFIIQFGASDLWTCPRYTHRFVEKINDIKKKISVGEYRKYDPQGSVPMTSEIQDETDKLSGQERSYYDADDVTMLEMYVDLELKGHPHPDGVAVPYIVTVDKTTGTVVSIYRNHTPENQLVKQDVFFVHWNYLPGFGYYGTGLCQILGGTAGSATSLLRQLIDAGTISNIPAGFKSRALRIKGDNAPLRPGELRDVDLPPGMVRNSIEWVPTKEPSVVFVQLLQELVNEGRRVGSVSDMKIGDSSQGSPVGTTLALIERHMRVLSSVQARNNVAMAAELTILKKIVSEEMDDIYEYALEEPASRRQDFASTNIIPIADPSATTMSQRLMRYTAAEQIASRQPHLYDMARLHNRMFGQFQLDDPDKIVPLQDDFVPQDPITENMRILRMQPVKAFIAQDHEAHLAVHMAALSDPLMQQIVGQSPNAPAIQASMAAHVQEHVAYAYRARMQKALGFTLPDPDQPLPPEMEASLSRFAAEGAQKVLAESQSIAAQQQAQQEAQDPMIQLRKLELQLEEREMQMTAATADKKMALEREIATLKAQVEFARIKASTDNTAFSKTIDAAAKRAEIASRENIAEKQQQSKAKSAS